MTKKGRYYPQIYDCYRNAYFNFIYHSVKPCMHFEVIHSQATYYVLFHCNSAENLWCGYIGQAAEIKFNTFLIPLNSKCNFH